MDDDNDGIMDTVESNTGGLVRFDHARVSISPPVSIDNSAALDTDLIDGVTPLSAGPAFNLRPLNTQSFGFYIFDGVTSDNLAGVNSVADAQAIDSYLEVGFSTTDFGNREIDITSLSHLPRGMNYLT